MLRTSILWLHRCFGLGAALFITLLGVTGAILVWEEELDTLLNPETLSNTSAMPPLPAPELIEHLEAAFAEQPGAEPRLHFLVFPRDPGRSAIAYVSGYTPKDISNNQAFIDRGSGAVLGSRNTISPNPFSRAEVIPWLYQFHYSLAAGRTGGVLLGVIAILWLLDTIAAWYLTVPRRFSLSAWVPAWKVARRRLTFDLHRAGGLWLTPVIAVIAFTGVYFNLYLEVFKPVTNLVSNITTQPFEEPPAVNPVKQPQIGYSDALDIARQELVSREVRIDTLDYLAWDPARGYYVAAFYTDRDLSRDSPSGHVYVNHDSSIRHVRISGEGTAADTLVDWQFPLHSGQILGLPGRIVVFVAGIGSAMLAITGVMLWFRKLRSRRGWG